MSINTQKGKQFEEEVQLFLRLKGYDVIRNELINGTQIDLVARKNDLFDNLCFVVECADRADAVGVDLVKQKASILLSLHDSKYLFRLIYVSRNGFTAEAKAFAASQPTVILLTLNDLENQLIDFSRYVDWYLSNYETSSGFFSEGRLYNNYVELMAQDEVGAPVPSLTTAVRRWLNDEANNLLFLLGEYGSGKTSFCRYLVYELLLEKFRNCGDQRFTPILFNLREYRKAFSIQQLVTDALVNQYGIELRSFMAFERICVSGKVLLVLDGFDEMADKSDKQTLVDCFRQIYILASLNTKIIVSCRSNFFQSNTDVINLLKQFSIEIPVRDGSEQQVTRLLFDRQGKVLTLEKLDDKQIRQYIQNRFGTEADAIYASIRGIHDLSDLSTRPVLLDMVVSTLPALSTSKKRINAAALYEYYTDRWTARDEWRVTIPLKVRQHFCEILGWHMYYNRLSSITYPRLERAMVRSLQHIDVNEDQLETFKNDIQTCSFLIREGTGDAFRFAHKSFVEYFVARKLVTDLIGGQVIEKPNPEDLPDLGTLLQSYGSLCESKIFGGGFHYEFGKLTFFPSFKFLGVARLGQEPNLAFRSRLEQEISMIFQNQAPSVVAREYAISEEIATFAIECIENMAIPLSDVVAKATDEIPMALLSEIFRLGKATEFGCRHLDYIRDYVLNGQQELLKVSFCAALARIPGAVGERFLRETQHKLSPHGWSYFLFELSAQSEYRTGLLRECFKWEDLRIIDKVICAHAIHDTVQPREQDMVTESLVMDLLDSGQTEEIKLGLALYPNLHLSSDKMAKSTIKVYRKCGNLEIKRELIAFLGILGGHNMWKSVRTLSYREPDPQLKRELKSLEKKIRDASSLPKTRESWDYAQAHHKAKERMWKSLRQ